MVRFAKWHPLVQFCFLLCVLLLTCLSRHPVPVALSLLGAAVYLPPQSAQPFVRAGAGGAGGRL